MAKKKKAEPNPESKFVGDVSIENAKSKWGQVKKLAKKAKKREDNGRTKIPGYSKDDLKNLAREYNARLPRNSNKRIKLNQSAEELAKALKLDAKRKKEPSKVATTWGKQKEQASDPNKQDKAMQKAEERRLAAKKLTEIKDLAKKAKKRSQKKKDETPKEKDPTSIDSYNTQQLQKMLRDRNIPGRSGLRTKQQMFDALGLGKKAEDKPKSESEEPKKPTMKVEPKPARVDIEEYPPTPSLFRELRKHLKSTKELTSDEQNEVWGNLSEEDRAIIWNNLGQEKVKHKQAIAEINRRNYQKAIEYGRKEAEAILAKADDVKAERDRLRSERDALIEKADKHLKPIPQDVQQEIDRVSDLAMRASEKYSDKLDNSFDSYRDSLFKSSVSDEEAQQFVDSITFTPNVQKSLGRNSSFYREEDIKYDLARLYKMAGGNITTLQKIDYTRDRAYASAGSKMINIGLEKSSKKQQQAFFHEFAHHIEYSLPDELQQLTRQFLEQRKEGEPKSMRELTGDIRYGEDEKGYPDKFLHPYVGTYYKDGKATEVLSVGLELFADPLQMRRMHDTDPEHFALMLGILKASKERHEKFVELGTGST